MAAGSDAIVVVEAWISEHYFTSDARKESLNARVLARRAEWEEQREEGTPRTRLSEARQRLLRAFVAAAVDVEQASDLNRELFTILGYDRPGYRLDRHGPVTFVRSAGLEEPVIAVIDARIAESTEALLAKEGETLTVPYVVEEREAIGSVARLLSTLFVGDGERPEFALVLAGTRAIVAERSRWAEGRYLAVDLQLVLERGDERRGGEIDRALTCLCAASVAPDGEGEIWWEATLAQSVKHTVGVSEELREGVRQSIEIVANDVVVRRARQGLPPFERDEAQPLAKEALRFLYRILFLLYAEASPELGIVPSGAPEYEHGYSVDRLRELADVPLTTPQSEHGTHLYDSLATLFRLIDQGAPPLPAEAEQESDAADPLDFRSLRADLFHPRATARIDAVGLGNAAVQQVLQRLLISRGGGGREAGYISYAELGINQLGAVYEGLMSYTGFFAETDLHEVARGGNPEKGSWVVPVERAEGIDPSEFVRREHPGTGEPQPVVHPRGSFVFRLAGRERQQSASYYTPEVLTRFVVSQALAELLGQDGAVTSAEEILSLTVCEPALGSGAFAIEAVRQLAEAYLSRRQEELGETIDPDDYPRELQQAKAHLALHQVYGVDLNATAVELAEISLWLDTMVEGLAAPWFGLRLKRGNSLIGARKAVVSERTVRGKGWQAAIPTAVGDDGVESIAGRIPHFLLPAATWGATAEVGREVAPLAAEAIRELKAWRRAVATRWSTGEVRELVDLGHRVERLWEIAARRLAIADGQARRAIPVWGRPAPERPDGRPVSREEIEQSLEDPDGAYQRLRRVMDAWCALSFWPLTEEVISPPTRQQWLDALRGLLGYHAVGGPRTRRPGEDQETLVTATDWDTLGELETNDRIFAGAKAVEAVLAEHPWLAVCERVADQQGFFHWQLDFAPVFDRGGFDLQVGNPPWVRPRSDVEALLAESDPWWALETKPTELSKAERRSVTLGIPGARELVVDGTAEVAAMAAVVGDPASYPYVAGLQPNLYRCFMERTWGHRARAGVAALIHPLAHFTEAKAGRLRAATYRRLRRSWQFINSLKLFEVHDQTTYGVHLYGAERSEPGFMLATSLYHPDTVDRSLVHDGSGEEPGLKDADGNWDLRPHRDRVLTVDQAMLQTWHDLLEAPAVRVMETKLVSLVNRSAAATLARLASARRIGDLEPQFSSGWHESADRKKGFFDVEWGRPASWEEAILQGPHLHVATPLYKVPNATMKHNQDWSPLDLEQLPVDFVPVTAYKPRGERAAYDAAYTHWGSDRVPARSRYRVAWRRMAANTGERTLISALLPPGAAHVNAVLSIGDSPMGVREIVLAAGAVASLLSDFTVRVAPSGDIYQATMWRMVALESSLELSSALGLRTLRLNCLTNVYADLWAEALPGDAARDGWTGGIDYPGRPALNDVGSTWTADSPLRRASDRRQALVELDALVAVALGVDADELCTIYRTQFPVLYGYDRTTYVYDANGRLVPGDVLRAWRRRGEAITAEERTATNAAGHTYTYELPYVTLDREADMRRAHEHFTRLIAGRGDG